MDTRSITRLMCLLLFITACAHDEPAEEEPHVITPVTVTVPVHRPLAEVVELTATSSIEKKNYVKASVAGYVESVNVSIGDMVAAGKVLYTLRTREAKAIGKNSVIDSLLDFSGLVSIRASRPGRVDSLGHQAGDYVQEGELLGTIAETNSLVFVLNIPFELRQYAKPNSSCEIVLPDKQVIKGTLSSPLSSVDPAAQTLSYLVRPPAGTSLPENLIVKIRLAKSIKENAVVLPKGSVLSNETLTEFWVMKLVNDSTAVKVPVHTGIESGDSIEIVSPVLGNERILLTGQYGLPDTASVQVDR